MSVNSLFASDGSLWSIRALDISGNYGQNLRLDASSNLVFQRSGVTFSTLGSNVIQSTTTNGLNVNGTYFSNNVSALKIPADTSNNRPAGQTGYIRYNTNNNKIEYWDGSGNSWSSIGEPASTLSLGEATPATTYNLVMVGGAGTQTPFVDTASPALTYQPSTGYLNASIKIPTLVTANGTGRTATNLTVTKIICDTFNILGPNGITFFSYNTGTGDITIGVTGYYSVNAQILLLGGSVTWNYAILGIRVGTGANIIQSVLYPVGAQTSINVPMTLNGIVRFVAGDVINFCIEQSSGANRTFGAAGSQWTNLVYLGDT